MYYKKIKTVEIVTKNPIREKGFARLTQLVVRNIYEDGSKSEEYLCDAVHRKPGADDAVVMFLHAVICNVPHVVIRKQARPILALRGESPTPIGFPAGCAEPGDNNYLARAIAEIEEEVGIELVGQVPSELGRPLYTSMGWITEKIHMYEMLLNGPQIELLKKGNISQAQGETMEAGGECRLMTIPKAMRSCKSLMGELGLRRLTERYYGNK